MRRVAITGIGVISPLGNTPSTLFDHLQQGHSAIKRLDVPWRNRLDQCLGAAVCIDCAAHFDAAKARMLDRASQFALIATRQAVTDAGLKIDDEDRDRVGVYIGTGMGGAESTDEGYQTIYAKQLDRVKPFSVVLAMNNAAAAWIGLEYQINGPNLTYSTACSSSAVAIGEAARRVRYGECDVMIAGGTEAPLSFGPMKAWEAMRVIASADPVDAAFSCKPFSANRTGMVLGEGAAILILEEWERAQLRAAPIVGELVGYGLCTDAVHLTRPTTDGQSRAMQLALSDAQLSTSQVDYLNAHGTGTPTNDAVESAAIKQTFGSHTSGLLISSTKSMHGHLLGAAGALEFAISLLAMKYRTAPPTMHLDQLDPACDLNYVANQARTDVTLQTVMSNSFAFGGTNVCLIARAA